ncbi:Uncharacterised protein [uncultured archaeon]|nr:Uncharacterised protein [uncultured archaeon]
MLSAVKLPLTVSPSTDQFPTFKAVTIPPEGMLKFPPLWTVILLKICVAAANDVLDPLFPLLSTSKSP